MYSRGVSPSNTRGFSKSRGITLYPGAQVGLSNLMTARAMITAMKSTQRTQETKAVTLRANSGVHLLGPSGEEPSLLDAIVNVSGTRPGKANESLKFHTNINLVFLIML